MTKSVGKRKTPHKPRGEQVFGGLTYSQIAKLSGRELSTVQMYGRTGRIDKHDTIRTLEWINSQRAKKGLPLLGLPEEIE